MKEKFAQHTEQLDKVVSSLSPELTLLASLAFVFSFFTGTLSQSDNEAHPIRAKDKPATGGPTGGLVALVMLFTVAIIFRQGVIRLAIPPYMKERLPYLHYGILALLICLLCMVIHSLGKGLHGSLALNTGPSFTSGLAVLVQTPFSLVGTLAFLAIAIYFAFPPVRPNTANTPLLTAVLFGSIVASALVSTRPHDDDLRRIVAFAALAPLAILDVGLLIVNRERPELKKLLAVVAVSALLATIGYRDAALLALSLLFLNSVPLPKDAALLARVAPALAAVGTMYYITPVI